MLSIEGVQRPATLLAFAGPAPGSAPSEAVLSALRAEHPQLLLMIGGVGDDDAASRATAKSLGALGIPVLVLAGGRDTRASLAAASQAAPQVVDLTSFDSVRIGNDTLVPVAGAEAGRYAVGAAACGFSQGDLDQRAKALGPLKSGRRWLIAWQAPAGGPARDPALDAGSKALEQLARAIGAPGGLFSWPATHAGRARAAGRPGDLLPGGPPSRDLQLVVPRLFGPALDRADGSRAAPGFGVLRLDTQGLQLAAVRTIE